MTTKDCSIDWQLPISTGCLGIKPWELNSGNAILSICVGFSSYGLSFPWCGLPLSTSPRYQNRGEIESTHASVWVWVHLLDQTTLIFVYYFPHPGGRWPQLTLHRTFLCSTAPFKRGRIVLVGRKTKCYTHVNFFGRTPKRTAKVHYSSVPHDPNRINVHQLPSLGGKLDALKQS